MEKLNKEIKPATKSVYNASAKLIAAEPVAKSVAKLVKTPVKVPVKLDPYTIIKFPLSTEKSIRQIEFDNRLVFVVDSQATKRDVKNAVEELFKVKVVQVNLHNSFAGQKRAYVKLGAGSIASDVSADLGLI